MKMDVFHQGPGNNGQLWFNVFDGSNWAGDTQVPNTDMSSSPGTLVWSRAGTISILAMWVPGED